MDEEQLAPCLWCKGISLGVYSSDFQVTYHGECHACGAKGPTEETRGEAIKAWNRGHATAAAVAIPEKWRRAIGVLSYVLNLAAGSSDTGETLYAVLNRELTPDSLPVRSYLDALCGELIALDRSSATPPASWRPSYPTLAEFDPQHPLLSAEAREFPYPDISDGASGQSDDETGRLDENPTYVIRMSAIISAACGMWNTSDRISPAHDTPALRSVAALYRKFVRQLQISKDLRGELEALKETLAPSPVSEAASSLDGWSADDSEALRLAIEGLAQIESGQIASSDDELFASPKMRKMTIRDAQEIAAHYLPSLRSLRLKLDTAGATPTVLVADTKLPKSCPFCRTGLTLVGAYFTHPKSDCYLSGVKVSAHSESNIAIWNRRAAPAPDDTAGTLPFHNRARAALLWVLYHHQGGSSPVGQPIRFALGMDPHEPLKPTQIARARNVADELHWPAARDLNR